MIYSVTVIAGRSTTINQMERLCDLQYCMVFFYLPRACLSQDPRPDSNLGFNLFQLVDHMERFMFTSCSALHLSRVPSLYCEL